MMLKTHRFKQLGPEEIRRLCRRPGSSYEELFGWVKDLFAKISREGDPGLRDLIRQYEKQDTRELETTSEEIRSAQDKISAEAEAAIGEAYQNLRKFHALQVPESRETETTPGVVCRREWRALNRVGLYVPGGKAPLVSTVLMLGVPAQLAGCREVILCTPAGRGGRVLPEILVAARLCGIKRIFKAGGAQAIGAMAVGTESVPAVDKIFGPGNRYVSAAKAYCAGVPELPAIDLLAGPSELLVIADRGANPAWIAADLLSQAEHGADSQVVLVTFSEKMAGDVSREMKKQAPDGMESLEHAFSVIVDTREQALEFSNAYGPEHLELFVEDPEAWSHGVTSAGSVFLGPYASVVFGDYASGTNHTLPTHGTSRYAGGLCVESFMRPVLFQSVSREGYQKLAPTAVELAELEGLGAHAEAIRIRAKGTA